MKKAQILSAIALAFALGVVAPVAMTTTGVYPADEGTVAPDKATAAEVNTAIAKVEGYGPYKTYKAVIDAVNATKADTTVTPNIPAVTERTAALTALNGAISDVDTDYTDATTLEAAITAAGNVTDYAKFAALVEAVNNSSDTEIPESKRIEDVIAKIQAIKPGYTPAATPTLAGVVADAKSDTIMGTDVYNNYKAIVDAVAVAQRTIKVEGNLYDTLKNAGATNTELKAADTIAKLVALADTLKGYDEYEDLAEAVETAKKSAKTDEEANATLISNINDALKAATKVMPGEKEVSLGDLSTPIINNPETPGTETPGTNEPGSDDPSAPGTGIVSTAEANAATTISIVAGLATALTALGAGVVAYRSARRSNK